MIQIAAHEDFKSNRRERDIVGGHKGWRSEYIGFSKDQPNLAQAWLLECTPQRLLRAHYHGTDQFQVIIDGEGVMGKHKLTPHLVHFSRAYTPYGPIIWSDKGLGLLTIRPRKDALGAPQFMPDSREKLHAVPNRKPWQLSAIVDYPDAAQAGGLTPVQNLQDDSGLGVYTAKLKPGASLVCPHPGNTDGQFVLVMGGSLWYQNKSWNAFSIVYITPDESAFTLTAGDAGMDVIVLNFPGKPDAANTRAQPAASAARAWHCESCAFVYDEALGIPEDGIAPGTRWEDVPESWHCPDCSATKADFTPLQR